MCLHRTLRCSEHNSGSNGSNDRGRTTCPPEGIPLSRANRSGHAYQCKMYTLEFLLRCGEKEQTSPATWPWNYDPSKGPSLLNSRRGVNIPEDPKYSTNSLRTSNLVALSILLDSAAYQTAKGGKRKHLMKNLTKVNPNLRISGFRSDVNESCALLGSNADLTGVSGQPISPIFKGQAVQEDLLGLSDSRRRDRQTVPKRR
jgi:hypothetical protein